MSLLKVSDPSRRLLLGTLGVALSMLVLAALEVCTDGLVSLPALVPPFGASVMIVFYLPESPMGRPWNVIAGHGVAAFVAQLVLAALPSAPASVQAALAVSGAGLAMLATRSFHPPGGATALLAVVAQHKLGFAMVLCPMLLGALAIIATRKSMDRCLAWLRERAVEEREAEAASSAEAAG